MCLVRPEKSAPINPDRKMPKGMVPNVPWRYPFLASFFAAISVPAVAAGTDSILTTATSPAAISRPSTQLLSPVTIDDKYLRTEIPGDNQPGTITLHGAVQEAAVHNRDVLKAGLEVSRFKWDYWAAQSNRLPNVRALTYLADQTVKSTLIPAKPDAFLFLSAFLPITQQYRMGLEARAVKLAQEIAGQELRRTLNETAAKVQGAYYKLALDQSLLDDVEDSITYLTELHRTVVDQVKRGEALKADQMEVAARLAQAELEATKLRNTCGIDREKFNHLLGRQLQAGVRLEVIPPISQLELDVSSAENKALTRRPEIRAADARVRQLRLEKKILLSGYIPNVSVGVVYISLPGFNNQVLPKNCLAPGFFMNWNAFDWGRKAFLAKARSEVEQGAALTAESAREEVLIDLHTQINKLSESRQAVNTTELARAAARERMRVSLNRYKFTASTLSETLQSQTALSTANNNYHEALLAFWGAKAEFDRAVGGEP